MKEKKRFLDLQILEVVDNESFSDSDCEEELSINKNNKKVANFKIHSNSRHMRHLKFRGVKNECFLDIQ
jgi:hypothetical protein